MERTLIWSNYFLPGDSSREALRCSSFLAVDSGLFAVVLHADAGLPSHGAQNPFQKQQLLRL
jgi:hypothetical protein